MAEYTFLAADLSQAVVDLPAGAKLFIRDGWLHVADPTVDLPKVVNPPKPSGPGVASFDSVELHYSNEPTLTGTRLIKVA